MRGDLGGFLLQFQRSHGNRFVQRLIDQCLMDQRLVDQRLVDQGWAEPGSPIPGGLKAAVEQRAGVDLSGVRVHYNSPRPARLGALAYTQGEEIHIAPGQGRHLAHEVGHVVQQLQGRVRATRTEAGVQLNDDAGLEREASGGQAAPSPGPGRASGSPAPIQLMNKQVDAKLREYWRKTAPLSEADRIELQAIFREWEAWHKLADELGGVHPAGKYRLEALNWIATGEIQSVNDNDRISVEVRRTLVRLWNIDTHPDEQVAFTAPPVPEGMKFEPGLMMPWGSLSPKAEHYSYQPFVEMAEASPGLESSEKETPRKERKEKKKRKKSPERGAETPSKHARKSAVLRSGRGGGAKTEQVEVIETPQEAALMIRSFTRRQQDIPAGFKVKWGSGLFEKRQDIVYTLVGEPESGIFAREGNLASWAEILREVPRQHWEKPGTFLREVQAVIRGKQTNYRAVALVAGAMICDVKHGVGEWLQLLSELYPMLIKIEKGMPAQDLFMEWYSYADSGGRDQRGRKRRPSYTQEENRVETTEWAEPTLIPSIGGFLFPGVGPGPHKGTALELAVTSTRDPVDFWGLALTNKYFYNILARRFRESRGLVPKKKE